MATPSPTDRPKGWEVRARRMREYNALHYPRMADFRRRGLTLPEIVDEVNKDSKNIDGHAWTVRTVRSVLFEGMDRGEFDARVREGRTRWSRARLSRAATFDAAALARAVELRQARLTYERIAERLQTEGYRNRSGVPWTRRYVSAFVHRRVPEAEQAALGIESKRGLSSHHLSKEEFEAAIAPRLAAMWKACLSQRKVVERLNAAGETNFEGQEWNRAHLKDLLKRQLGQAEYAALVREILGAGGSARDGRARRHDETMLPRILELRDAGLTRGRIAEQLNDEAGGDVARLNSVGQRWTKKGISKVLRRSNGGAPIGRARRAPRSTTPTEDGPGPAVHLRFEDLVILGATHRDPPRVLGVERDPLTKGEFDVVRVVLGAQEDGGIKGPDLEFRTCSTAVRMMRKLAERDPDYWGNITVLSGRGRRDPIRFAHPGTF
ncbi:MAG: hypothetical protein WKF75_00370 [Singulisphaera sp.]